MKTIKILGAGLSGLTAAINLRKAGYDVMVYEKQNDTGTRFHGDLQGIENWSEKEDVIEQIKKMNLELNFEYSPFKKLTLSDGKDENILKGEKPLFYLLKRGKGKGTLDYSINKQAINMGIKIKYGKILDEKNVDIVATGPSFKNSQAIVKGIIFKTNLSKKGLMVLNDEMGLKWYSYFFVIKNYACLSTVTPNNPKKLNECFEKAKKFIFKKYKLQIENPKFVGGTGSFLPNHRYEWRHRKNNTLYVGEAAGLQDFLWGFGMRFAIESGYLAAESIIKNKNYKKIAKKKFLKKLKSGIVNRFIWEILNKKLYKFIVKNPEVSFKHLYSFHNFNLIQRFLYPFAIMYLRKQYPKIKF